MSKRRNKKYLSERVQMAKAMMTVVDCAMLVGTATTDYDEHLETFFDVVDLIEDMQDSFDKGNGKSWESYWSDYRESKRNIKGTA